jgi:hypothetical protein
MRKTIVAALALTGSLLAPPASAHIDDSNYFGPPVYPVPYAYGYTYARARCGHYYAEPWIVHPCGSRLARHHHRHKKRLDK